MWHVATLSLWLAQFRVVLGANHGLRQVQYQVILDNERALAVTYWRLGAALEALRNTFGHGH